MFWMTLLSVVLGGVISTGSMIVFEWWRDRRNWARRFEKLFLTRRVEAILTLKRLVGEIEGALWPATIEASRMEEPAADESVDAVNPATRIGRALSQFTQFLATDGLLLGGGLEEACQSLAGVVQAYRRRFSMTKDADFSVSRGIEASLPSALAEVDSEIAKVLPGCSFRPLPPGGFMTARMAGGERATQAMKSMSLDKSA